MKKLLAHLLYRNHVLLINKKIIGGIIGLIILISIAFNINRIFPFPHFWFYLIFFLTIGLVAFFSIYQFQKSMNMIIGLTIKEPPCEKARIQYQKCQNLRLNHIIPIIVNIIFIFGGCMIFSNLKVTPTFMFCLVIFIPVVYISIKGYLKYIYLCMFIYRIASSNKNYKKLPRLESIQIPPLINWYKKLEKLFYFYQAAFLFLGLLYIIAFAKFCFSHEFGVYVDSIIFYILWLIIFCAIVLAFPIILCLEMKWMKKIGRNIAEYYFIQSKKEHFCFEVENTFTVLFADMIRRNIITEILKKRESTIQTLIFKCYSRVMAIINLTVSIITILQFYNLISL